MLHILFWILAEKFAIFQKPNKWCRWVQMYRINTSQRVKFVENFLPSEIQTYSSQFVLISEMQLADNNEMVLKQIGNGKSQNWHISLVKHEQCVELYTYIFMHKYLSLEISLAGWTALRSMHFEPLSFSHNRLAKDAGYNL